MNPESLAETQEVILEFLTTLARHVSGDVTLNQIRVLQFINLCSRYRGEATSNVKLCSELDLPSATVSRAIVKFIEAGIISDKVDPDDGRGRLVVGTGVMPGTNQHLDPELAEHMEQIAGFTVKVAGTDRVDEGFMAQSQERVFEMFMIVGGNLSGDLTLNQIRVLQFINLCWRHRSGAATSHTEICTALQMPSSTVSRAVAKFIESGLVVEEMDPADGRRRLVVSTGRLRDDHDNDLDLLLAQFASHVAESRA